MVTPASPRDLEVLAFITSFIEEQGFPPTVREIGLGVGMSSPSTVQGHIMALVQAGRIERAVNGSPRALRVIPEADILT